MSPLWQAREAFYLWVRSTAWDKYSVKDATDAEKEAAAEDAGIVEEETLHEVAPPSAKAERMVKHIKKGYSKDGKLTDKEKSIA